MHTTSGFGRILSNTNNVGGPDNLSSKQTLDRSKEGNRTSGRGSAIERVDRQTQYMRVVAQT